MIYQITNIITNDFYIGYTKFTAKHRFQSHKYNAKYNIKSHLYNSMNKYGIDNFTIKVIQEDGLLNPDEAYWIKTLKPTLNMTKGGEGGDTSNFENFKISMKEYHARKPKSEYATYGMLGKKLTEESKTAIGKKNSYPVICEGIEYPSIASAEQHYKSIGKPKSIRKRIDNPKHTEWYRLREKRSYRRLTNEQ